MSTGKKLPPHGTVARYRLELKPAADGTKGTPCDRCKTANSEARRNQRERAAGRPSSPAKLSLVGPGDAHTSAHTDAHTDVVVPATPTAADNSLVNAARGPMEQAVEMDLRDIKPDEQVPFHRSLSAMARELAKDIDSADSSSAQRRDARKQLFEVLKSLRTRKEGDGNTALDIVLGDFGLPLVSGDAS